MLKTHGIKGLHMTEQIECSSLELIDSPTNLSHEFQVELLGLMVRLSSTNDGQTLFLSPYEAITLATFLTDYAINVFGFECTLAIAQDCPVHFQ